MINFWKLKTGSTLERHMTALEAFNWVRRIDCSVHVPSFLAQSTVIQVSNYLGAKAFYLLV